ncbi:hypothetical protein BGP78_08135 [Pseudoalteromonas sp. MSK9-3]|uniref:M23/M56 family metallopeptidase n=1 Tax=Pseudoalteromonas sp. MSK9-3 TaxID=1897633 RepID=UPI000E6BC821|nr:M23/M56 family metallopeptidase [Pseudoalteromonas sp. MSK9-3]RJE77739.1 hypothetical protein BGP78_08135 [Pseudoalteromonas sp. MSK9-3]
MLMTLILSTGAWLFSCLVLVKLGKLLMRKDRAQANLWFALLSLSMISVLPISSNLVEQAIPEVLHTLPSHVESAVVSDLTIKASEALATLDIMLYTLFTLWFLGALRKAWLLIKLRRHFIQLVDTAQPYKNHYSSHPMFVLPIDMSPFVFGLRKPKIILPRYFLHLKDHEQHALLCHELTHISYKDHISVIMWRMLCCLFWFNPFIHEMEKEFVHAMEHRCDRKTVQHFKLPPLQYAQSLLTCLKRSMVHQHQHQGFAHFSSSALSVDEYKQRLTDIVKPKRISQVSVTVILCAVSMGVLFTKYITNPVFNATPPDWQYPVKNISISSHFGHISKIRNNRPHGGVDFIGKAGTSVYNAAPGKVLIADATSLASKYGNVVLIQHSNGYQTLYSHLDDFNVEAGDWLKHYQVIGSMGSTGKVTGAHLHFEMLQNGQRIDPLLKYSN